MANTEYEKFSYLKAIKYYEDALKKNKDLNENDLKILKIKLAWSYKLLLDNRNAERIYRSLFDSSPVLLPSELKNYLYFAQTLASNGKHNEAKAIYQKFNELQELDKRSEAFTKFNGKSLETLTKNSGSYKVDYLGINTSNADFSPVYYKKGLVFVSGRGVGQGVKRVFEWDANPFLDLYYLDDIAAIKADNGAAIVSKPNNKSIMPVSKFGGDNFGTISDNNKPLEIISNNKTEERPSILSRKFTKNANAKYHEGPATFFHDGSKVVFTRNNYTPGEKKSKAGITKLKLYIADLVKNEWQKIKEFPYNSNDYSNGHPTLTIDDKIMYFVSNMPGGYGGTDIYMSIYDNGKWSKPLNLGSQVNTIGNEVFPYVDDRGNLYFSSDGMAGLGDLDLFFVAMNTATGLPAGKPRNLGAPLNSNKDDFGLITDSNRQTGFFSSNRKHGGTDDDIYKFTRTGSLYGCRDVVINVRDEATQKAFDRIRIEYYSKSDSSNKNSAISDNLGNIKLCLEPDNTFNFKVSQNGYLSTTVAYSTANSSDYEASTVNINLKKGLSHVYKKNSLKTISAKNAYASIFRGVVTSGRDSVAMAGVRVKFYNQCDGTQQRMITGPDGSYEFKRDIHCDYILEALRDDFGKSIEFLPKILERKVSEKKVAKITNSLFDTKLYKVGDVVKLDNIYYDYDSNDLRKDAQRELLKLAATLQKYPNMIIEVLSHTDSRGNAQMNLQLSQRRAENVVDFLAQKGIARERMKAIGRGELEPINDCGDGIQCTDAEYQRNRRTEFRILQVEKIL